MWCARQDSNLWPTAPEAVVGDIDVALGVEDDAPQRVELARRGAAETPRLEIVSVLVELGDARIAAAVSDAVGDVDVAGAVPPYVGRSREAIARDARAG